MLERSKVVEAVLARIVDVVPEAAVAQPNEEQDLREFSGFDSLVILEILVWLEGEFAISIPDEELVVAHFSCVGKMADYVVAHQ